MLTSLISTIGSFRNSGSQSVSEKETGKTRQTAAESSSGNRYDDQVSLSYVSYQTKSLEEINQKISGEDKFRQTLHELKARYESGSLDYYSSEPYENQIRMGITALGGYEQLKRWESQGLELEEDTLISSGQSYSEGLRQLKKGGTYTKRGLLMNQHGLVRQHQQVPEWFDQEQKNFHSQISGAAARAFQQGESFFIR
ncbi:hypothetical protein [Oceanospirillum sediminis]|uniref:Uncharacterized protein n=1 Tax=Oceanospirillum sediminis TaxID=2760088 RepID=A0A839IXZ0_9GAMM|nr:hypothetical protein [Oceanospirillum sediminis]MBB1489550.1 hypothetical protein [Oceanospirillum sediminis]